MKEKDELRRNSESQDCKPRGKIFMLLEVGVWRVIPDTGVRWGEKGTKNKCILNTYQVLNIYSPLSKLIRSEGEIFIYSKWKKNFSAWKKLAESLVPSIPFWLYGFLISCEDHPHPRHVSDNIMNITDQFQPTCWVLGDGRLFQCELFCCEL